MSGRRLRKQDWLELGFHQLIESGAAGLTVDRLCRAGGRTRGSFYHHFRDHDAFVEDLMRRWQQFHTDDVISEVEVGNGGMRPQSLHDLVVRLDHRLDVAVRLFAQTHPVASTYLKRVDTRRLDYLKKLYRDALPETLADELARVEYAAFVGAQMLWPDAEPDERLIYKDFFARAAHALKR